jgi:hypothetical protein
MSVKLPLPLGEGRGEGLQLATNSESKPSLRLSLKEKKKESLPALTPHPALSQREREKFLPRVTADGFGLDDHVVVS